KKRLAGHRKIGINSSELTYAAFQRLRKLAPRAASFVDVSGAVMKARLVQDAQEVDLIQRACDIASRAFEETLPFIQTGVTEAEVASELVYRMQKNGATAPSFRTIVGSGPNGAEPHYTAGPRKIERGDMIVIDFGAQYHMYCSDITRTVVTNERGVYVPGFGGVRIEDDVLITKNGPRVLSTAPREFLELA